MKTYNILRSERFGVKYVVDADSEATAIALVESGEIESHSSELVGADIVEIDGGAGS